MSTKINIHSEREIDKMREACQLAARLLNHLGKMVKPGVTTMEINNEAERWTQEHKATSAPLGYGADPSYAYSICTSVDDMICHGYPTETPLREGQIVNIDVSPRLNGWIGDTSKTFLVGECSVYAQDLVKATEEAMYSAINVARAGHTLGDIGAAIQMHVQPRGFSVVREMVGHGVGRVFHTAPQVLHWGVPGKGLTLRPGMIFTIEPMINQGNPDIHFANEWEVKTKDGKFSAQFEHTILVTEDEPEILTSDDKIQITRSVEV